MKLSSTNIYRTPLFGPFCLSICSVTLESIFLPNYTGWAHESHQNIMGMGLAMDSDDKISKFSIGVAMAMLNASHVLPLLGKDTDSILLSYGCPSNIPSATLIQIFLQQVKMIILRPNKC